MSQMNLMELINHPGRVGVMATCDRAGNPNLAVFSSPYMPDEMTLVMGLADTKTAQNLLETGRASFMSVIPNENPFLFGGARIYLKVRVMEKEGPNFEMIREKIRAVAGDRPASRIRYAVFFDVEFSRPLIDWENK